MPGPRVASQLCHLLALASAGSLSLDPFHSHKEGPMICDSPSARMSQEARECQTRDDTADTSCPGARQTRILTSSPAPTYICLTVGRRPTPLSLSLPI